MLQIDLPGFHESKLAVLKVFHRKHKPNIIHLGKKIKIENSTNPHFIFIK